MKGRPEKLEGTKEPKRRQTLSYEWDTARGKARFALTLWRRELDLNRRDPFTSRLLHYIGIFFFLEMTGVADAGTNPIQPGPAQANSQTPVVRFPNRHQNRHQTISAHSRIA